LEELGAGFPYIPPADDSDEALISHYFANSYPHCFNSWSKERLEALIKHYAPGFTALYQAELDQMGCCLSSKYLDITSDIMVALHFTCSEYRFFAKGEKPESPAQEDTNDGFLFVYDLKEIGKAEAIKLVYYPGYSYFCKEETEDKLKFQSFGRITHQRGAFLAPKWNEKGDDILYDKWKQEIQETCLSAKITVKNGLKKELYETFGGKSGMEYYFPKIPCTFPKNANAIQRVYKELEGITLL
jgi:hypothetical protein